MSKFFLLIFDFFEKRKTLFYVFLTACLTFLIYFSLKIKFNENIMQMLPHDKKNEKLAGFLENSKFTDRIMVSVSFKDSINEKDPDQLVEFSDSLVSRIQLGCAQYIGSITHIANDSDVASVLGIIDSHLPVFLDESDYLKIDSIISPDAIRKKVRDNFQVLTGPSGIAFKQYILKDPLGLNLFGYKKLKSFQIDENLELYNGHFLTRDKNNLLIFIEPRFGSSETAENSAFFSKLRSVIKNSGENSSFEVFYFGAPVVAAGNSEQIKKDSFFSMSLTIVLLVLIVLFYFRKAQTPFLIFLPVVFGALFALSMIYFVKGSISIISIGAGSIILGIAVNYSLHFLTNHNFHFNTRNVIKELSFPLTVGSLTTIGGFLCLQYVNAPVLNDLGLFAAFSLIGAAFSSLIFLPHFLSSKEMISSNKAGINLGKFLPRWMENDRNKMLYFSMIILLTPLLFYFAGMVEFEDDMNKINYLSDELKSSETRINQVSSYYQKSVFVIASAKDLQKALLKNEQILPALEKLKIQNKISGFSNVSTLIPSIPEQQRRIARWNAFWTLEKQNRVFNNLIDAGREVQFKETAFIPFKNIFLIPFSVLSNDDTRQLIRLFLKNFIEEGNGETSIVGIIKTRKENLSSVYDHLASFKDFLIFDRQFISDTLIKAVKEDFNFITIFSSLLVFFSLLISYGRIELALISFIPMVISWIWILGLMAIFGIKFTIINIILSTLVFALGDDYCIFTMDGLQQQYARGLKNIQSIKTSILLSVITTIVGLGTLIFASHPALRSIAAVSIIGILSVWFISQTLQPILFNLLITRPTSNGHPPYTFFGILKSMFAFGYFTLGAFLLAPIGLTFTRLLPFNKSKLKYAYHWLLSKFTLSLVYIMFNVKKRIINQQNEDFSKPAVIISNHQSVLDILFLVMLHPKLILFTNKWVWNSPVFGPAVRFADYYPVMEGVEPDLGKIEERVKEGYSVVIFPEGTRSLDGTIKRFHKGAFFLAEKLNLEILPVIIHGAADTLKKNYFYLRDGQVTLKFLPRIKPDDIRYGITYSERTKRISAEFRSEYNLLASEISTPSYYRNKLFSNYIFKGPVLEWYMKIKVRLENDYSVFNEILPKEGRILDIGCGYGFMSNMLGFASPKRVIRGIDYDGEKIEVASLGNLRSGNVSFDQCNAIEYDFGCNRAIILSDVLHYLQPSEQSILLEKCIRSMEPGGMIVIRDGVKELKKRHRGTWLSEFFSTRVVGFNKTQKSGLSFLTSAFINEIASRNFLEVTTIDSGKFTSNVIFVLKGRLIN